MEPKMNYRSSKNSHSRSLLSKIFLLACLAVVSVLVVWGIKTFELVLWGYVYLSLIVMIVACIIRLFGCKLVNVSTPDTDMVNDLEYELEVIRAKNSSLNNDLEILQRSCMAKDCEIDELKRSLKQIERDSVLEKKYYHVLKFLQDMNRYIEDLPENAGDFKEIVGNCLNTLLSVYRYRYVDYSPEFASYYDCEYYPALDSPYLVCRCIADSKGNLVLKGKIHLPESLKNK